MITLKIILKNNKRAILFFTVLLVIIMAITIPLVYKYHLKQTENEALALIEIAAAVTNKQDLFSLDYDESDVEKEFYKGLKDSLNKTVSLNKTIRAAYFLMVKEGKLVVAVDSESPGTKYYSAPGEVFAKADEKNINILDTKKSVVLAPIEYEGEKWITVFMPIYDAAGNFKGAYLNDYSATAWNDIAVSMTAQVVALLMLSYIAVATSLIIARLNHRLYYEKLKLIESGEEVAMRQKIIDSQVADIAESQKRLSKIFYSVPTKMIITSSGTQILDANEAFLSFFNYKISDILGKTLKELELFIDDDFCHGCVQNNLLETGFHNQETLVKKKSGEYYDMIISLDKIVSMGKEEYIFSLTDITKRKRAEEEVKRLIKKYRTIVSVSNTGGWEYDINRGGFYLSEQYYFMIGKEPEGDEFSGECSVEEGWINLLHPDDKACASANFHQYITSNDDSLYENYFRMLHTDGHWVWVLSRGRRLRKEDGTLSDIIVGTHIDITEIKNKEEKIQYLNYHDQLTGIMNRRYYEESIDKLIRSENLPLAVIMADVNGLKLTNDAFGHLSGDKLLTRVAEIIESEARPQDVVARLGGDEFVMLMPRSNSVDAEKVVRRINESIQDYKIDNIVISVSFGWATKKNDDEDFTEVYKRAEYRMYRSKLSERSSKRSQSIKIIFKTLQEKSEQEKLHSERVSYFCRQLAGEMELPFNEIKEVETAGLMHDIGKIGIDEQVLNKIEKFTESDRRAMRKHPDIGYRILSSSNEFSVIADYVLFHHERWDGKGYPRGLKGENIPLASRILTVADSYDAMTSERCYKKAMTKEQAAAEIIRNAGTQFDPSIAQTFIEKVLKLKIADLPMDIDE